MQGKKLVGDLSGEIGASGVAVRGRIGRLLDARFALGGRYGRQFSHLLGIHFVEVGAGGVTMAGRIGVVAHNL